MWKYLIQYVYHAMYFNLQWKDLMKCAINVSMLKNSLKLCQKWCESRWRPHFHVPVLFVLLLSLQHRFLLLLSQFDFQKLPCSITGLDLHRKVWVHFFLQNKKILVNNCSPAGFNHSRVFIICFIMLVWLSYVLK